MSENIRFTHLHVHSEYSLLDGSAKINELVLRAKELGMDSMALTDHGVMFGVIDFYKAAKDAGIKPILGCECYVSSGSRLNRDASSDNFYYHLVLLAENMEGYKNLIKLVSIGYTEGFYYRPRVDIEVLRKYSKGIIALSACLAGPVARNFLKVSYDRALKEAELYNDVFGEGNFFLELQDHGIADQKKVNEALIKISRQTGIPLVCTNDIHYIYESDAKAHEILLCIQTGKTMQDDDRMIYEGEQFFVKSPQEMLSIFKDVPEALENTYKIAERCNIEIKFNEYKLPRFNVPDGKTPIEYLKELCYEGIKKRYPVVTEEIILRLEYELETIRSMGFADYFLVTWDFIKFAVESGIPVGPGRGSGAGCIVAYALRITNVDPLKFNLLFERFLNPERISMPDFDIDFCYERRQEVIDYVVNKYGSDHVAQIITFGTMAARAAIRDVGRAIGMKYSDVDVIAKMIPFAIGMTIKTALEMNAGLNEVYENDENVKYLMDMAMRLEGLPRHASTHAAGVVICDRPVDEYVPLYQNDGVITTQFPMNTLEKLGLLKMDFLGLRTLTVIKHTVDEVKRGRGIELDLDKIDLTDKKVFDLISQAKTEGVFQLESAGMKSFMKELKPASIEDLTAGISLFRPGPMEFIPKYVKSRNSNKEITYTHIALKPILEATYGCIVYQEQVMQIFRELAGYSLGRSDLVRKAMSKKQADVLEQERKNFIYGSADVKGCAKNGIPAKAAEQIFDEMSDFAKYAFNKSHAACYAMIGYQTAWLKLYYPTEFMAALMTSVMDWTSKIAEYIKECKTMGITVKPPDVNEGHGHFSVSYSEGKPCIRFGLNAIKNVGRPTVSAIFAERESKGKFKSMTEFISRIGSGDINRRCLESLVKAGVFDCFGGFRSQYYQIAKDLLEGASITRKNNIEGQMSLFDLGGIEQESLHKDQLPKLPEFKLEKILADEKEVLGIYVSGHPVLEYEEQMKKNITASSLDFRSPEDDNAEAVIEEGIPDGTNVVIGGIIAHVSIKYTKNNDPMAFLSIEDFYGELEVIVFPNTYEKHSNKMRDGMAVLIEGKVSIREDKPPSIICNEIKFLLKDTEKPLQQETLWLKIPKEKTVAYDSLMNIFSNFRGNTSIIVYEEKTGKKMLVDKKFSVDITQERLLLELKNLLGEKSIAVK